MTSSSPVVKKAHPRLRNTSQDADQQKRLSDERRRRIFLGKVHQKGEDKKWDVRAEQILREEYISSQRQWLESQDRSAPPTLEQPGDEIMDVIDAKHAEEMIDQVISQETQEVEALVAMLEDSPKEGTLRADYSIRHESDDENFDSIFAEILATASEDNAAQSGVWHMNASPKEDEEHGEAMDTTG
ncbi:MAG: hypothetical protein Q9207_001122 [Kuettlingeria erythrocarpa]